MTVSDAPYDEAVMATRALDDPFRDPSLPTDEELREVLSRPDVQEQLARYAEQKHNGTLKLHSDNEARAILGLPPLPEDT